MVSGLPLSQKDMIFASDYEAGKPPTLCSAAAFYVATEIDIMSYIVVLSA
jgi:hypothetical protein